MSQMNTFAKLIASIAALIASLALASLALAWIAKNGSRLWYDAPDHAVGYAKHRSRCSHAAVIRVHHNAGNVIATHEHAGDFVEP
jgi:hypothetical protein